MTTPSILPRLLVLLLALLSISCDVSWSLLTFPRSASSGCSAPAPIPVPAAPPGTQALTTDYLSMSQRLIPTAAGRGIVYTDSQTGRVRFVDAAGVSLEMGTADRVESRGAAPGSPSEGRFYENTSTHLLYYHNGTSFQTLATAATSVPPTRQILCGNGLTGCGDFSADRTMAVLLAATPGLQFSTGALALLPKPSSGLAIDGAGAYVTWATPGAIGSGTPAAVTGTTITATTQFTGPGTGLTGIPNGALTNSSVTLTCTGLSGCGAVALGGTLMPAVTYGTGSNTATQGNDARLAPAPSGAGKMLYDNGTAYVALAAGTSSQVLVGGAAPAFGNLPLAALPAHASTHLPAGSDPLTTAAAVDVGTANAAGGAASFSRSDHVHRGSLLQTVAAPLAGDTTTASAAYVDLISQAITTQAGTKLKITVTTSSSNGTAASIHAFRILVDSGAGLGCAADIDAAGGTVSCALLHVATGLASGAHTIKLQWRTSAGTARIRPVAAIDTEHASLVLEEVLY